MLEGKDRKLLWLGTALGAGVAIALIFIAVTSEGVSKPKVILLVIAGIACLLVPAYELGYIKKSSARKDVVITSVTLIVIVGVIGGLGWTACAVEPYCFFLPLKTFAPSDKGLVDGFLLWAVNPTSRSLDDVSFRLNEMPKPTDDFDRAAEISRNTRLCTMGHVRADSSLSIPDRCQLPIQLDKTKMKGFYFEITTKDVSFYEFLNIYFDGKTWREEIILKRFGDNTTLYKVRDVLH